MATLLSTKKLAPNQKALLLNTGIGLVEYDAIHIQYLNFNSLNYIENAIITSQNAAKAILEKNIKIEKCFCVGEKTAIFLKKNNFHVVQIENYGADLANKIVSQYADKAFTFFCGNLKRKEIPQILNQHDVDLTEIEVYKTTLTSKEFSSEFDAVLFFSPSGVKSFTLKNNLSTTTAICIGKTTASEAKKYTQHILFANKPSIENVIVQAVKKFRKND